MDSPIWLAVLGLLGIPAVTSGLTAGIKYVASATGISPKILVYGASLIVTGLIIAAAGLPAIVEDPTVTVGVWLGWATANAELARRLYEVLWERVGTV